jgi:hypothetical protein
MRISHAVIKPHRDYLGSSLIGRKAGPQLWRRPWRTIQSTAVTAAGGTVRQTRSSPRHADPDLAVSHAIGAWPHCDAPSLVALQCGMPYTSLWTRAQLGVALPGDKTMSTNALVGPMANAESLVSTLFGKFRTAISALIGAKAAADLYESLIARGVEPGEASRMTFRQHFGQR